MTLTFYELMCLMGGLAAYATIVCIFFYRLNEKSIKELDKRMDERIDKLDKRMEQGFDRMDQRLEKSEAHWREMFIYFNSQLIESKKN